MAEQHALAHRYQTSRDVTRQFKAERSIHSMPTAGYVKIVNNVVIFMLYVKIHEYVKIIKWLGG